MAEPTSPVALIWKELVDRYTELKNLGKWLDSRLRVVVIGESQTGPERLYQPLFGQPDATVGQAGAHGGEWTVAASYSLDDVPGRGQVGKADANELALTYLREADAAILVLPVGRQPTELERGLWDHLMRLKRPRLVAVWAEAEPGAPNLSLDRDAWTLWVREIQRGLSDSKAAVLPQRGLLSEDVVAMLRALGEQETLSAEAKVALPSLVRHEAGKEALLADHIKNTANTAAFLGLSPIPFSDVAAITPLQVMLVCRVAAAYGRVITPAKASEFVTAALPVLGAGFAFRALFKKLTGKLAEKYLPVKMGIGAAVAWVGTQAIGRAAMVYFRSSAQLSPEQAAALADETLDEGWPARSPFVPAGAADSTDGGPEEPAEEAG